jgi:hypothetical protein
MISLLCNQILCKGKSNGVFLQRCFKSASSRTFLTDRVTDRCPNWWYRLEETSMHSKFKVTAPLRLSH